MKRLTRLAFLIVITGRVANSHAQGFGEATGTYFFETGDIVISTNQVASWRIRSDTSLFNVLALTLPPIPGVTNIETPAEIGQLSVDPFTITRQFLGPVALPLLPPDDLTLYWMPTAGGTESSIHLNRCPSPCDLNCDGVVDAADAGIMFSHWGTSGPGWENGDVNGDGIVDAADAGQMFSKWSGDHDAVIVVPEPANPPQGVAISMVGLLTARLSRRDSLRRSAAQGRFSLRKGAPS